MWQVYQFFDSYSSIWKFFNLKTNKIKTNKKK